MTTLCRGCKALIIPTDDEYNLYSLQRAIYPVDPLRILDQPNSFVQLECEDGYVVKKFYRQGEDQVVFWQQMLAECENHKKTEPESPTVITPPGEDVEDDQTPDLPKKPDPKPDSMPGPETVIEPPIIPPPPGESTPAPPSNPFGWPWTPPDGWAPYPVGTPDPTIEPAYDPVLCHPSCSLWHEAIQYHPVGDPSAESWALFLYYFFQYKALHPYAWISCPTLSYLETGEAKWVGFISRPICEDDPC